MQEFKRMLGTNRGDEFAATPSLNKFQIKMAEGTIHEFTLIEMHVLSAFVEFFVRLIASIELGQVRLPAAGDTTDS